MASQQQRETGHGIVFKLSNLTLLQPGNDLAHQASSLASQDLICPKQTGTGTVLFPASYAGHLCNTFCVGFYTISISDICKEPQNFSLPEPDSWAREHPHGNDIRCFKSKLLLSFDRFTVLVGLRARTWTPFQLPFPPAPSL